MSLANGLSGFVERAVIASYFGASALTVPANIYLGLCTAAPLDFSNTGSAVTYGASSMTDVNANFPDLSVGGWVITSSGKYGQVLSNTSTVITLSSTWTGGTPTNGEQYDAYLTSEPSGNSYARNGPNANDTSHWTASNTGPSALSTLNASVTSTFATATGAGWGAVSWVIAADASTLGHVLSAQRLQVPFVVNAGVGPAIATGGLTVGLQ